MFLFLYLSFFLLLLSTLHHHVTPCIVIFLLSYSKVGFRQLFPEILSLLVFSFIELIALARVAHILTPLNLSLLHFLLVHLIQFLQFLRDVLVGVFQSAY